MLISIDTHTKKKKARPQNLDSSIALHRWTYLSAAFIAIDVDVDVDPDAFDCALRIFNRSCCLRSIAVLDVFFSLSALEQAIGSDRISSTEWRLRSTHLHLHHKGGTITQTRRRPWSSMHTLIQTHMSVASGEAIEHHATHRESSPDP